MSNKASTGIGITDRSIASLASGSQLLMPQNAQRGAAVIMNVGNANIAIAFAPLVEGAGNGTATAALNTAGSYTIVPTGSWTNGDGGFVVLGAIYVIGTTGQPVSAFESS